MNKYGITTAALSNAKANTAQVLRRIETIEQNIAASIAVNGVEIDGVNETNAMHVDYIEDNLQVIKVLLSGIKEVVK